MFFFSNDENRSKVQVTGLVMANCASATPSMRQLALSLNLFLDEEGCIILVVSRYGH